MTHNPSSVRHPAVTATAMALTWLPEGSVAVRTMRMPFLAVPVGGTRRGGDSPVSYLCFGLKVRDLLCGQPGFPDLCVRSSPYPDSCFVVEWGDSPPELAGDHTATTMGRFYGYSEAAISAFVRRRFHETPSSAMARTVFPHGTVTGRRGLNFPPERTSTMCPHTPPCPTADAADRQAARISDAHPEQGWSVNCTFLRSNTARPDCPGSSG